MRYHRCCSSSHLHNHYHTTNMKRIIFILCCICLMGCKTTTVVVPEYHTDTVTQYRDRISRVHDSIYVREYTQGDTVYITRDRWHASTDTIRDSVYVSKVDSIAFPVEVEKQVRYIPSFYKGCTWCFWIIIVAFILWIAWRLFKRFYLHK